MRVNAKDSWVVSAESVTEGHPDKLCDQISDEVLDSLYRESENDPRTTRCACEVVATKGLIIVTGEINANKSLDIVRIARETVKSVGYDRDSFGVDPDTCIVVNALQQQDPDIRSATVREKPEGEAFWDSIGAGDQGLMYGYACDETDVLMPLPIILAHRLTECLAQARKTQALPYLRPDGKALVALEYRADRPIAVRSLVIAANHDESSQVVQHLHDPAKGTEKTVFRPEARQEIWDKVVTPILQEYEMQVESHENFFCNSTGVFVHGGPQSDAGLTGRKIIVDTYGGIGRHGGGCFSGKDPTKVDRSGAYAARYLAKNIVGAGLAKRCEVQIAYTIGVAEPVSLRINSFGTGELPDSILESAASEALDLRPGHIIRRLELFRPIYRKTAAYGHFGRNDAVFTWEKLDLIDDLKTAVNAVRRSRAVSANQFGGATQ